LRFGITETSRFGSGLREAETDAETNRFRIPEIHLRPSSDEPQPQRHLIVIQVTIIVNIKRCFN
jgi:hypothetical protein